jgi:hypothetical protein
MNEWLLSIPTKIKFAEIIVEGQTAIVDDLER